MKLIKRILFLLTLVLFLSCSNEDGIIFPDDYNYDTDNSAPISQIYFTYKVNEQTLFTDNWIFIHSDEGELLDYRQYERGEDLEFEKETYLLTDEIVVTLFKYTDFGNNKHYDFYSTKGVELGSVWDIKRPISQNYNVVGNFDLTLINFPLISGLLVSNQNRVVNYGNFIETQNSSGLYTYDALNMDLYEDNEYFITYIEDKLDFKYHFVNNVQNGSNLQVDYNEFRFFDSYLDIELPLDTYYRFSVNGYENGQDINEFGGYLFGRAQYHGDGYMKEFLERNPLRLGFLNRYSKYRTELDVYYELDGYYYNYLKYGEKPSKIIVPENPNLIVSDQGFNNFTYTTTLNHEKYSGKWLLKIGEFDVDYHRISWELDSPNESTGIVGNLPEEFAEKYFEMDKESLVLKKASLWMDEEGKVVYSYNDTY